MKSLPLSTYLFLTAIYFTRAFPQDWDLIDWLDDSDLLVEPNFPTSSLSEAGHQPSSDLGDDYWATGLSPAANLKRFKAIRAGLLLNLNDSVSDLGRAIASANAKEAQYHLRKLNDKWNRLENLQKAIMQLIPDDDLDTLMEEARLFEDNRDVVDQQRELAADFLDKLSLTDGRARLALNLRGYRRSRDVKRPAEPVHINGSLNLSGMDASRVSSMADKDVQELRRNVIKEFYDVVHALNIALDNGTAEQRKSLQEQIQLDVWPKLVNLSLNIYHRNVTRRRLETLMQVFLQRKLAHVLYKTGSRKCSSPDETFYQNVCVPYGSAGDPCLYDNQQLYDGPNNEGICDCLIPSNSGASLNAVIYYNSTGQCYVPNSQGPCALNEWIIVKNGTPSCHKVPNSCNSTQDGSLVYWSPDPLRTPETCVQLGSRQSCGILNRRGPDLVCSELDSPLDQDHRAPFSPQPCWMGSLRQQAGLCHP